MERRGNLQNIEQSNLTIVMR